MATYDRIDDAVGFTYQLAGHLFYVLAFPNADKTWAYDIAASAAAQEPRWHEWVWLDTNGTEHRHRANCAFVAYDEVVVGDWESANLYAFDGAVFLDDGQPIKRRRHLPHLLPMASGSFTGSSWWIWRPALAAINYRSRRVCS